MASTMLLATSDSDAAKKPRLRLIARRSSSVRPLGDFQRAMSACIEISVGIQWLLQPERYFSHAQRYLSGRSWFTSARQLIMALSSTRTRAAPRAISPRPVASECSRIDGGVRTRSVGTSITASLQSSISSSPRSQSLLACFAGGIIHCACFRRCSFERNRIELAVGALQRGLLYVCRAVVAQIISRLQSGVPSLAVKSIQLLSAGL